MRTLRNVHAHVMAETESWKYSKQRRKECHECGNLRQQSKPRKNRHPLVEKDARQDTPQRAFEILVQQVELQKDLIKRETVDILQALKEATAQLKELDISLRSLDNRVVNHLLPRCPSIVIQKSETHHLLP